MRLQELTAYECAQCNISSAKFCFPETFLKNVHRRSNQGPAWGRRTHCDLWDQHWRGLQRQADWSRGQHELPGQYMIKSVKWMWMVLLLPPGVPSTKVLVLYCFCFFFSFSFSAFIRVINSLVFNRLLDNLNKFCLLYFQVHAHKWRNVLCGKTDRKA